MGVLHLRAAAVVAALAAASQPLHAADGLSVQITSPMGRTGNYGALRVVAQIHGGGAGELVRPPLVRFFVDGQLLGEDSDGPPYAVEWVDENPFERREISVSVDAGDGVAAADRIVLEPFELTELTEVSSVLVEATVEDAAGRHVMTLGEQAFHLTENGQEQKLDLVRPDVLPATYLLLIDGSQSMSRRIDDIKNAARRLTAYMKPDDRMLVVPFANTLGPVTGPTSDRATILEAIQAIRATGGTAIIDSLAAASALLADAPGRRALVLMTDGYDERSERDGREAIEALQRSQTTTYVVGIGGIAGVSTRGQEFLRDLARQTAGRAFFPSRDADLPAIYDRIVDELRHRYLLGYTPTNTRRDGSWRAITVSAGDERLIVHARPGYFAPSPPPVRPMLEFTVTDTDNRYLDVERDDLQVEEDGVPQQVDTFQESTAPVSIVLTLDESGSMRRAAATVVDAAHRFVASLRPADSLGVSLFADGASIAQDLTTDRQLADKAIDQYASQGGTALFDALGIGFERLRNVEGRRALVVLTDGRDENNAGTAPGSVLSFDAILRVARETDVTVFAIGLGPNVDRAGLETLAATTGGLALFPSDVGALDGEYKRIVENLRRRYLVAYTSTNRARTGDWRAVTIVTRTPHTVVRSRGGFFAPDDGK